MSSFYLLVNVMKTDFSPKISEKLNLLHKIRFFLRETVSRLALKTNKKSDSHPFFKAAV